MAWKDYSIAVNTHYLLSPFRIPFSSSLTNRFTHLAVHTRLSICHVLLPSPDHHHPYCLRHQLPQYYTFLHLEALCIYNTFSPPRISLLNYRHISFAHILFLPFLSVLKYSLVQVDCLLIYSELCFECDCWFNDRSGWERHCQEHLERPEELLRGNTRERRLKAYGAICQ